MTPTLARILAVLDDGQPHRVPEIVTAVDRHVDTVRQGLLTLAHLGAARRVGFQVWAVAGYQGPPPAALTRPRVRSGRVVRRQRWRVNRLAVRARRPRAPLERIDRRVRWRDPLPAPVVTPPPIRPLVRIINGAEYEITFSGGEGLTGYQSGSAHR